MYYKQFWYDILKSTHEKKMAKVQRHLSIHFNTRFFKGITREEILSGIEKKVELDNVGSVQFMETDCIISVKDLNTILNPVE